MTTSVTGSPGSIYLWPTDSFRGPQNIVWSTNLNAIKMENTITKEKVRMLALARSGPSLGTLHVKPKTSYEKEGNRSSA